jgi:importin subunit alpha-2
VVIPALRAVGNIVTGSDVQTQSVVDAGGLQHFAMLLKHERRNVKREAAWAISNVAAGTSSCVLSAADTAPCDVHATPSAVEFVARLPS